VEAGLLEAGFEITTNNWLDAYDKIYADAYEKFRQTIKQRAKQNHTNVIMEGMGAVMPQPEYDLEPDADGDVAVSELDTSAGM
jgi:beta-glucosidase